MAIPHHSRAEIAQQKFRQMAQNSVGHADAWAGNFGEYAEHLCSQAMCAELCGVAIVSDAFQHDLLAQIEIGDGYGHGLAGARRLHQHSDVV